MLGNDAAQLRWPPPRALTSRLASAPGSKASGTVIADAQFDISIGLAERQVCTNLENADGSMRDPFVF